MKKRWLLLLTAFLISGVVEDVSTQHYAFAVFELVIAIGLTMELIRRFIIEIF